MSEYVRPAAVQWEDRGAGWAVFLILLSVYTATFTGLPDNPAAEVEFQTTSALARNGSLALGGTPEAEAIVRDGLDVRAGSAARGSHHYAGFGVGQALVAAPLYVAGHALSFLAPEIQARHAATGPDGVARSEYFEHLVVGWRNPIFGALTAMLVALTSRRMGVGRRKALFAGLAYGLCTFAWPQARSTSSDVQVTFFLFAAFHLIVRARETFARLTPPPPGTLWLTGAALGAAVLTRIAVLPAVLVLTYAAWRVLEVGNQRVERAWGDADVGVARSKSRQRLELGLPLLVAFALFGFLNWIRFGTPWSTGYESTVLGGSFFDHPPHLGLAGLLLAPGRGLLWMAPAVVLAPIGFRAALRNDERLWPWVLGLLALAVLGPMAFSGAWHGAWTYGPRYALPLLPFAWLGFALAFETAAVRSWTRRAAFALCAFGLLVAVPAALVDHTTHQDLALQAARLEWPDVEGATEREREDVRFERVQWDLRFAAPWAHWRILRHRVAGLGEDFRANEIFFTGGDEILRPASERERGFRHVAWVDLVRRLGGSPWPGIVLCSLLFASGLVLALRAVDVSRS